MAESRKNKLPPIGGNAIDNWERTCKATGIDYILRHAFVCYVAMVGDIRDLRRRR